MGGSLYDKVKRFVRCYVTRRLPESAPTWSRVLVPEQN